jgi:hypothetical protein
MAELRDLETTVLIDMLSQHTLALTHLFYDREFTPEYDRCIRLIKEIQNEIASRAAPLADDPPNRHDELLSR